MSRISAQIPLFDDSQSQNQLAIVATVDSVQSDDPAYAAFQRLVRQIHKLDAEILAWNDYRPHYSQKIAKQLMPQFATLQTLNLALLRQMDAHFLQQGAIRGKTRRKVLTNAILELARSLLDQDPEDIVVQEVTELYNRYSDISLAEQDQMDRLMVLDLVEAEFGIQLDPDELEGDLSSVLAQMAERFRQEQAQNPPSGQARRPSARTAAAQQARQAEATAAQLSVRDLYRRLASHLHPDRQSDHQDETTRTVLMQRVNQAYDSNNLFELLSIQLEIPQTRATGIAGIETERIAHYNHALRQQVTALKAQLEGLRGQYRHLFQHSRKIRPADVDQAIRQKRIHLNSVIADLQNEVRRIRDPKELIVMLDLWR
ncbi:J domain-containing protein [Castellaniella sp.]|uniref:J domain-containing protein n=1 Tax=Castellaniella sp. TaxID=1955812 RepID=UPI002AFE1ACC|nr:J domain-containing protein [Castellaniella sp.]